MRGKRIDTIKIDDIQLYKDMEQIKQETCPVCGNKAFRLVFYRNKITDEIVGCSACISACQLDFDDMKIKNVHLLTKEEMPHHSHSLGRFEDYEALKNEAFSIGRVICIGKGKNPNEDLPGKWNHLESFELWRRLE